jgi:hypothetical protein
MLAVNDIKILEGSKEKVVEVFKSAGTGKPGFTHRVETMRKIGVAGSKGKTIMQILVGRL